MAKKEMKSGACGMCGSDPCCCHNKWCRYLGGLVVLVLGLLMLWPQGWFTFEHSFGLLVALLGLKVLFGCRAGKCY